MLQWPFYHSCEVQCPQCSVSVVFSVRSVQCPWCSVFVVFSVRGVQCPWSSVSVAWFSREFILHLTEPSKELEQTLTRVL